MVIDISVQHSAPWEERGKDKGEEDKGRGPQQ
jgi:hypothetical protein